MKLVELFWRSWVRAFSLVLRMLNRSSVRWFARLEGEVETRHMRFNDQLWADCGLSDFSSSILESRPSVYDPEADVPQMTDLRPHFRRRTVLAPSPKAASVFASTIQRRSIVEV